MTDTVTSPVETGCYEEEFAHPCTARTVQCPNPATWAVWVSHGKPSCPTDCYICDACKAQAIKYWERSLKEHYVCRRCKVAATGQLSDNVRFIKL